MNQPHGTYTEADLERIVARDFPKESITAVKDLLARYGQESWQGEILRVQMACLKCANGDLKALEQAVGEACSDYRDILSEAEYPAYGKARSPGAKEKAIESDWNQLQSWLKRQ
jgi:hypothetical protein